MLSTDDVLPEKVSCLEVMCTSRIDSNSFVLIPLRPALPSCGGMQRRGHTCDEDSGAAEGCFDRDSAVAQLAAVVAV